MLSIAMNLPVGLEAASSTGLTKEIAGGVLFSDSLEQAGGLKRSLTASPASTVSSSSTTAKASTPQAASMAEVARSVRQGLRGSRTADQVAGAKTGRSASTTSKGTVEPAGDDAEVVAAFSADASAPILAKKADVLEGVTEDGTPRGKGTAGEVEVSQMDRAGAAPLDTTHGSTARKATPLQVAAPVATRDDEVPIAASTSAGGGAAPSKKIETSVADGSTSVTPSRLEPAVAQEDTGLSTTRASEKQALVQIPVVDGGGESTGHASAGTQADVDALPLTLKGKAFAGGGTALSSSHSALSSSLTSSSASSSTASSSSSSPIRHETVGAQAPESGAIRNQQNAISSEGPVQVVVPTSVDGPGGTSVVTGALAPAGVVSKREQGKSAGEVVAKVGTKRSDGVDPRPAKAKTSSIDAPAPVSDLTTVVGNVSVVKLADVGTVVPPKIASATDFPRELRVSSDVRANPVSVAQISGRAKTAPAVQAGIAQTSLAEGDAAVPDAENAKVSVDAMKDPGVTIDRAAVDLVKGGTEALPGTAIKATAVAGGRERKGAVSTAKMGESAVVSGSTTREPVSVGKDVPETLAHPMRVAADEKKVVAPEDAAGQVVAAVGAVAIPTSGVSAPLHAARVPDASTGTPLAGVVRNDPAGAMGESSLMQHTMIQATSTVLEVGVPGGTHGWLKIRAELGEGGTVNASISSSTRDGQETLHRDLAGMSAFLESERVPVSLQVGHVAGLAAGMDMGKQQAGGSMGQGSANGGATAMDAGGQPQGQREQQAVSVQGEVRGEGREERSRQGSTDLEGPAWSHDEHYRSGGSADGGNWLNVMA